MPESCGININSDAMLNLEPLRALGIDKGTLEAFGLGREQIREVYRNLYIGTNVCFDMLENLTKHNSDKHKVMQM